jgi:hypothetical protein
MDNALLSDRQKPEAAEKAQRRMILPQPMSLLGTGQPDTETEMMAQLGPGTVFMMGDNPVLSKMPDKPQLLDFFHHRFTPFTRNHLLQSANVALKSGMEEKVVLACLLHDIANGALIRVDHGYWGAQLIEPYVSEEITWAVRNHQALRFFADESVGYKYPEAYIKFFGPDYQPAEYVRQAYERALEHRWYMTSRLITLNDLYSFDPTVTVDPQIFTDIIGRHFKQPKEGLGFDGSSVAHMWRTMIWPNNLL